jgi:hypothetical protein
MAGDVVADELGRAGGDARFDLVERRVAALAHAGRLIDVDEGRLRLHGRQLLRRQEPGRAVQVVAGVVVPEQYGVPQVEVEQCLRRQVAAEAAFGDDVVQ